MILFINACVREGSRTKCLAGCLLRTLPGSVKEVDLSAIDLPKTDDPFISWRNAMCACGDFRSPVFDFAKDFAAADTIVIAAPYWDLSFPAVLKQYLEQICVTGLTFCYENDRPKGLCRAEKCYYVTTAGGPIVSNEYGYGYVKTLMQQFFGIRECELIKAEGLDILGADVCNILTEAEKHINGVKQRKH